MSFKNAFIFIFLFINIISCTSYEKIKYLSQDFEIPTKSFTADFNQTWSAVINVMKKYDIQIQNQETGVIKTRWMDNTLETNFADAFGSSEKVKSARFKILVNVTKGYRANTPVTRVSVYKRQIIEQDFLNGWKEMKNDSILEKTILYRIGRLITMDRYLQKVQKAEEEKQIQNFL
ncbi:MAG: hypothetical protein H6621_11290 [Halobacteriovoraceae bacterium]|nr:hypothetical protein [Halobacteriovoraceae bacterium]MCB9095643.1 hypothetical protein [Halobacteriovoraceae bacterium]